MKRKGQFKDTMINSRYLDEAVEIRWYLPEGFSDLTKCHVCIMQDGNDYFQMGRVATLSDKLHEAKAIEDTVFVGIHYTDRFDRQDKYHPHGKKNAAYIKFLVNEVVPFLDKELPGYHVGSSRALMGDSLAGTLGLMTALKYPNTFGKVIMQSPYVDETVLHSVRNTNAFSSISIYHTIGTEETEVETTDGEIKDFYHPNLQLRDLLETKGSEYVFHELDGKHTWKPWQKDMERLLQTMFS